MVSRRNFLKTVSTASALGLANPIITQASRQQDSAGFFNVHPFIENNPDAVFIMRTNVDVKTNSEAIKNTALEFSRSVFVPSDSGIPLTHMIPIKPNLVGSINEKLSFEYQMGIFTNPYFVEGVIEGMKELGLSGEQFFIREVNRPEYFEAKGFTGVAERTGVDIRDLSAKVGVISENDLVWKDNPEGVWFRKIPYLWPVNAPDTFLLNIAKFKAHGMGLTLCCKNIQGSIAHNYQQHCHGYNLNMQMNAGDRNPDALADIRANWERHNVDGVPRWDKPGASFDSGLGMEAWASHCLDNNSATPCGLHIIEGVYGRDGNFQKGPHKEDGTVDLTNSGYLAKDYMSNIIIFGRNQFNIDIIGHWLGGHEPGNMGLFHMALDFGMNNYLNPFSIPVYEWKPDGTATLTPLSDFDKTPLLTYYMQRNYNDQTEPYWHLMDEPFDYGTVHVEQPVVNERPEMIVLSQNRPNPFNPNTSIEYSIPSTGAVRLEVYNANGQLVEVLADGYMAGGSHMAVWNTRNHSSGIYFYRLRHNGFNETKKMTLLK